MLEYTSERGCFTMASKGQKSQKVDKKIKEEILKKYFEGYSSKFLEKEYGVSCNTIQIWGKIAKWPDKYGPTGVGRGHPKEKDLTKEDYKKRYEIPKKYQAFLKEQRERK